MKNVSLYQYIFYDNNREKKFKHCFLKYNEP